LFFTLPTRALTGQQVISSAGTGASSALSSDVSTASSPSQTGQASGFTQGLPMQVVRSAAIHDRDGAVVVLDRIRRRFPDSN